MAGFLPGHCECCPGFVQPQIPGGKYVGVAGAAGVGFLRAYREDLRGFAIGWAVAVSLVFATWLLLGAA